MDEDRRRADDFGQNAAAEPRFTAVAARGVTVTISPAEMLNDANGLKSRGNDGPEGSAYRANMRGAKTCAVYTFAGKGDETYLPRFSFFGYRYLSIVADGEVEFKSFESVPVSSIAAESENGTLETGNKDLNRFIENVRWSHRSNYLSVPTDCPQRDERLGWTADTQVFAPAALYLADCGGLLDAWMDDLVDSQHARGSYPSVAPLAQYGNEGPRVGWLYRCAAGIATDPKTPGFKNIIMAPKPDRRLGHVKAEYKSAAGLIKSAWRYEGEKWIWEFAVPDGATADVTLPGEKVPRHYMAGSYAIRRQTK